MLGGIFLIAAALYFQYMLDELPCTMCIQVRLWITLFVVVSLIGLLSRNTKVLNKFAQFSIVLIAGALVERSYMLLGTERGFVFSNCGVDLGMPAWFAIEKWLPWLYRVETSCGYTPEIIFGITMAETLMVLSILLLVVSFCVWLASLINIFIR
jgi:disulfide bond formation protein DsbB